MVEAAPKPHRKLGISLDRHDASARADERRSERAGAGSQVEHEIAWPHARRFDQLES